MKVHTLFILLELIICAPLVSGSEKTVPLSEFRLKMSIAYNNPISPNGNFLAGTIGYSKSSSSLNHPIYILDLKKKPNDAEQLLMGGYEKTSPLTLTWRHCKLPQELYFGFGSETNQSATDPNQRSYSIAGLEVTGSIFEKVSIEIPNSMACLALACDPLGESLACFFLDFNFKDLDSLFRLGFVDLNSQEITLTEIYTFKPFLFWSSRQELYIENKDGIYKLNIAGNNVSSLEKVAIPGKPILCGVINNQVIYLANNKLYCDDKIIYPTTTSKLKSKIKGITVNDNLIAFSDGNKIVIINGQGTIISEKENDINCSQVVASERLKKVFLLSGDSEKLFMYDYENNSRLFKLFDCRKLRE